MLTATFSCALSFFSRMKKTEDGQCIVPQTSKSVGVSQKAGGFGVVPWVTGVPPPLPSAFPLSPPPHSSLSEQEASLLCNLKEGPPPSLYLKSRKSSRGAPMSPPSGVQSEGLQDAPSGSSNSSALSPRPSASMRDCLQAPLKPLSAPAGFPDRSDTAP